MHPAQFTVGKAKIFILQGDIIDMTTDAIVNAANPILMGGGGVDGAIHRKGGVTILDECKKIRAQKWPNGLPTGKAVITNGGNLKAKHVIHTVGPMWRGGTHGEAKLLAEAYQNSLKLAASKGLATIAFPAISTGAYGYPVKKASRIALTTAKKFLENENQLNIFFVLFSTEDFEIYQKIAKQIF